MRTPSVLAAVALAGAALAEDGARPALRPLGLISSHLEEGPIGEPRGVAVDPRTGEVWVVDTRSARLGVFTPDGMPLFATTPSNRLREPTRAAIDAHGRVLVLDIDRSTVKVLNYRGEYTGTLELPGLPETPSIGAIAVDARGQIYVGENSKGRVHVYSPELQPLFKFGDRGAEEGQFQSIAGIAADEQGIYVVDHQAIPVQVFDRRGRFARSWGAHDMGASNFSLPEAVALDGRGHVIVIDALRHEIKFFDTQGRFLDRFGGYGARAGNVAFPTDVAVDAAGRLFVAERGGARVQVFELFEGKRR